MELAAHPAPLGTLAGEQEHDLGPLRRRAGGGPTVEELPQPGLELRGRRARDREPVLVVVTPDRRRVADVLHSVLHSVVQESHIGLGAGAQLGDRPGGQREHSWPLVWPLIRLRGNACGRRGEHDVNIRARDAERADAQNRLLASESLVARDEVQRPVGQGLGLHAGVQRRRNHPVLGDQHGLDQPGDARGRLGVADVALHRPEQQRPLPARSGDLAQGFELDPVADARPGAVRLDVVHSGGIESRVPVGGREHLGLTAHGGLQQEPAAPAVVADRAAEQHGAHTVAAFHRVR